MDIHRRVLVSNIVPTFNMPVNEHVYKKMTVYSYVNDFDSRHFHLDFNTLTLKAEK